MNYAYNGRMMQSLYLYMIQCFNIQCFIDFSDLDAEFETATFNVSALILRHAYANRIEEYLKDAMNLPAGYTLGVYGVLNEQTLAVFDNEGLFYPSVPLPDINIGNADNDTIQEYRSALYNLSKTRRPDAIGVLSLSKIAHDLVYNYFDYRVLGEKVLVPLEKLNDAGLNFPEIARLMNESFYCFETPVHTITTSSEFSDKVMQDLYDYIEKRNKQDFHVYGTTSIMIDNTQYYSFDGLILKFFLENDMVEELFSGFGYIQEVRYGFGEVLDTKPGETDMIRRYNLIDKNGIIGIYVINEGETLRPGRTRHILKLPFRDVDLSRANLSTLMSLRDYILEYKQLVDSSDYLITPATRITRFSMNVVLKCLQDAGNGLPSFVDICDLNDAGLRMTDIIKLLKECQYKL